MGELKRRHPTLHTLADHLAPQSAGVGQTREGGVYEGNLRDDILSQNIEHVL